MYRSMIIGEGEKIKSIPLKHILYFAGLVVCALLIFRFGFMNMIGKMNNHNIGTPVSVIDDVQEPQHELEKLEKENNMYDIVGTVGDHYIVKTDKGLKRVKIKASDNKRIGDQIKIEKL